MPIGTPVDQPNGRLLTQHEITRIWGLATILIDASVVGHDKTVLDDLTLVAFSQATRAYFALQNRLIDTSAPISWSSGEESQSLRVQKNAEGGVTYFFQGDI